MRILFLDDMEERHVNFKKWHGVEHEITYVYDFESCIKELTTNEFDFVSLDHDLSIDAILCNPETVQEKTGSDVAKEMCEIFKDNPNKPFCIIHSLNPVGAKNMKNILKDDGFKNQMVNFANLKFITWH